MLTRDRIFSLDDTGYEDVDVPAWKDRIRVRGMTMRELDIFLDLAGKDKEGNPSLRARAIVWCAVDEQGRRLFDDADVLWLEQRPAKVTSPIWLAIARLSGIITDEQSAAELGKGSATEASGSSSPSASAAPSQS